MVDGESEIDDVNFFFSDDGKTNAKNELHATLEALLNETRFDDNSSACKFPARKEWLKKELNITKLPKVVCSDYDNIISRLSPKSATLVFPSAHINSPASMFGHTFLRINSKYNSKLLAYAINYAAAADPSKENAIVFSIKGLVGGYYGHYSLLPYYEKLKEYRDGDNRDVWEYDLNLTQKEVLKMVRHIWELNGTHSDYFFFTENCAYNMLWLIEVARPSLQLRKSFKLAVIPLETIHVANMAGIIEKSNYRPSRRTTLLKYEDTIDSSDIHYVKELVEIGASVEDFIDDTALTKQEKMYILEATIEYLEYSYAKSETSKEEYIEHFHHLTKARAKLGLGEIINIQTPVNPTQSHRAIRVSSAIGYREDKPIGFLGMRLTYHSLEDSSLGFLRGTQIEFLNLLISYDEEEDFEVDTATILSVASFAQRSEFSSGISWRVKLGWDRKYVEEKAKFSTQVGLGYSLGNKSLYTYMMIDPLFYTADGFTAGIGSSLGLVFDKYNFMQTNIEVTYRKYDTGIGQALVEASHSFRLSQNTQLKLNYNYIQREMEGESKTESSYKLAFNYYF